MTGFEMFLLAAFLVSGTFNLAFLMVVFATPPHPKTVFKPLHFWEAVDRFTPAQDDEKEADE